MTESTIYAEAGGEYKRESRGTLERVFSGERSPSSSEASISFSRFSCDPKLNKSSPLSTAGLLAVDPSNEEEGFELWK